MGSKLKLTKKVICDACKGVGGKGNAVQKCYSCDGNGIKISVQPLGPGMVQQVQRVCPDCAGEGEVIDPRKKCKVVEPGCKRVILYEGMPMHRNPFEKGHLYIEFDVIFPPNGFLATDGLKELEKVLPKREIEAMEADLNDEDTYEAH